MRALLAWAMSVPVFRTRWPARGLVALLAGASLVPGIDGQEPLTFVATAFLAQAQPHGLIRRSPANLEELHDFLLPGVQLIPNGVELAGQNHAPSSAPVQSSDAAAAAPLGADGYSGRSR